MTDSWTFLKIVHNEKFLKKIKFYLKYILDLSEHLQVRKIIRSFENDRDFKKSNSDFFQSCNRRFGY